MTNADAQPTFEGRPLAKPEEPVVDQGLQFDITTLMSRRGLLGVLGGGLGAVSLAACGVAPSTTSTTTNSGGTAAAQAAAATTTASSVTEIPDETAGPYPGDGSNGADVLEQSGVVRSDIRSSFGTASATAEGIPMTLKLTVLDIANAYKAFAGVAVYVWHCNRDGEYSMYSSSIKNENYLRGVQIADDGGKVKFTSIFPACYSGRWPHIHFEVYPNEASITDSTNAIATSQVALPQEICNAAYATSGYEASVRNLSQISLDSDNVFGDDGGKSQLATVTGDPTAGYQVSLTVGVDTRTQPTGGSIPSGGRGPGSDGQPKS